MKRLLQGTISTIAVFALLLVPTLAQAQKPVAVISISGVDNILGDFQYLAQAAGAAEVGQLAPILAGPYTMGLDKTKPAGAIITMADPANGGDSPVDVLGFLPVTNLSNFLKAHAEQIGEPEDAGDGVLLLEGADTPIYVKETGGWAFVGISKAAVMNPPAGDPTTLLGGIDKEYDIAIRVNVQNIPEPLRQMAIEEMQNGFESELDNQITDDESEREIAEKLGRNTLNSMKDFINDSDTVTIGWLVDASQQDVHLDFGVTAVAGSDLAKQFATLKDTKSDFAGFELPGAAFTMNFSGVVSEEDQLQATMLLNTVRDEAIKEIDNDADVPNKAAAKAVLSDFFAVLIETFESGKIDGGAAVMLDPESLAVVAGGYVADGAKAQDTLKRLIDLAKQDANNPITDVATMSYGGVNFHTMSVPLPDDADADARKLLGDKVEIAIGTAGKAIYFGMGKGAVDQLKNAIDTSKDIAGENVPPFRFMMALGPILKFAASMENNPIVAQAAEVSEDFAGRDRISIIAVPITNGAVYRLKVDDGVLQLIGKAAAMAGAGNGAGAPF